MPAIKENISVVGLKNATDPENAQNYDGTGFFSQNNETYSEGSHGTAVVAGGQSLSIPFGGVDEAKRVYLKASAPCTYKLNAGTENLPLCPIGYISGDATRIISAITVDVPAGDPVTIEWHIFG